MGRDTGGLKHRTDHKNPDFIFGVSDVVDEECRELIESAFHTRLIDLYGAAEAGCIAWECKTCRGYHINMDTVIIEYIKGGKAAQPGTPGNIVVTNLHSFAMPIIRYDLGDIGIASLEKPICGNDMPILRTVNGRSDAFVVLPSGDRLSPMYFFAIMRPVKNIDRWKVIQKDIDHIAVLVIPSAGFSSENVRQISSRIQENIEEKVHIEIRIVDEIPMEKSGKIRAVLSHVTDDFLDKPML
jgi:phenylacetate-CoA ligase